MRLDNSYNQIYVKKLHEKCPNEPRWKVKKTLKVGF